MSRKLRFGVILFLLVSGIAYAQSQLVGLLTTSSAGVELQREGTEQWVTINVESIVSVGDRIRTGSSGGATIRFVNDDSYVTLGPDTLIRIDRLEETTDGYSIAYNVVQGLTEQVLMSPDDKPATFEVTSLGLQLMTRGGQFALEVEKDGHSDLLAEAGSVFALATDGLVEIPPEHGLRAASDGVLGEVVPAANLPQLRVALDGVPASFTFDGDVLLNVRHGPNRTTGTVGTLAPDEVNSVLGISEDGKWYRVRFNEGYGWVSGQSMTVETDATFLLTYPEEHVESVTGEEQHVTASTAAIADAIEASQTASEIYANPYSQAELEIIAGINQMRLANNLWPMSPNEILTDMARDQAEYLLTLSDWPADPHADAQGRSPRERAVTAAYNWPSYGMKERTAVGEITYAGFNSAAAINYWQHSQLHFQTATNAGYREVGVSVLPHPQGSIYMVVFGSRPDVFPALVDAPHQLLYLSTERYRFANGGSWITDIRQVQLLPSVLSEINESGWTSWGETLNLPSSGDFAIAYRGNADQLVISSVKLRENIAWLPGNLPTDQAVQAVLAPVATATISLPTSNFQPVTNNQVFMLQPVFATNTPAPR